MLSHFHPPPSHRHEDRRSLELLWFHSGCATDPGPAQRRKIDSDRIDTDCVKVFPTFSSSFRDLITPHEAVLIERCRCRFSCPAGDCECQSVTGVIPVTVNWMLKNCQTRRLFHTSIDQRKCHAKWWHITLSVFPSTPTRGLFKAAVIALLASTYQQV